MEAVLQRIMHFSEISALHELSIILTIVIIITGVLKMFRQPIIIGYLIAGVIIGPFVLGLASAGEHSFIELFSHIGIALLLFMVGLGLNPRVIKEHGKTALGVGMIQIGGTFIIGFIISQLLGFDPITSAYIAGAMTFSSTIVIVKLLSDLDESESLYGKISIGVLIIQDIVVMLLLMLISISSSNDVTGGGTGGVMLLGGLILLTVTGLLAHYVLPRIMDRLADVQEYLLLLGIGWCLLLGSLFWYVGFSFEIGCLLAGMSFALSPYRMEIANKLKSLRDFFLVLFFIHVGMQLSFANFDQYILPILLLTVFVIVGKPALIYVSSKLYGFTNKTSLKAGLSLGQISEFSFLLIAIGITAGHIQDSEILSVVMFVGLLSITVSTYTAIHNGEIYTWWRKKFGEEDVSREIYGYAEDEQFDVILFGYGKMGANIAEILEKHNMTYLVIDHNPNLIRPLALKQIPHIFADATNSDVYKEYISGSVKLVISTIRDYDDDWQLIKTTKERDESVGVMAVTNDIQEALLLYDHGADYVIMPNHISAHHTGVLLEEVGLSIEKLVEKKVSHIEEIKKEAQKGIWRLLH